MFKGKFQSACNTEKRRIVSDCEFLILCGHDPKYILSLVDDSEELERMIQDEMVSFLDEVFPLDDTSSEEVADAPETPTVQEEYSNNFFGKKENWVSDKAPKLLKDLGYSDEQINILIKRKMSRYNLVALIESTPCLIKKIKHEQLICIISKHGGAKALMVLRDNLSKLIAFGFTAKQIVAISSVYSGGKNINVVLDFFDKLKELGFSQAKITALMSRGRSCKYVKDIMSDDSIQDKDKILEGYLGSKRISRMSNS